MNTIIVIGPLNYPKGGAPTNRIHLYCKSIMEIGGKAFVISLSSPFSTKQNFTSYGRYQGVPYFYVIKNFLRDKSFFKRNSKKFFANIFALLYIRNISRLNPNCALLLYNTTFQQELILTLYAKLKKIPIIRDISEAPKFLRKKDFSKIHQFLYKKIRLKLYDSIIVISQFLLDYHSNIFETKYLTKIPILVDFKRFDNIKSHAAQTKCITYAGYMGKNKDGLNDLLDAFSLVHKKLPNIMLNIIGTGPTNDIENFKLRIRALDLKQNVILFGQIESSEIPQLLKNSDLLVLARPDSIRARAGFPTKLGEYLASEIPVVTTSTGEIPKYLKDGESAYFAEPGDIKDIADKIVLALNDPNSKLIAKRGYEIALNNFNYKIYSTVLNDLISCLRTNS